jgi:hypothetical protein
VKRIRNYLPLVLSVMLGVFLQVIFITADNTETPRKAALQFVKAYYLLDQCSMAEQLCKGALAEGRIDDYMYKQAKLARDRGFTANYLKSHLYDIHVETVEDAGDSAKIRITGQRRTSMNPLFEYVAVLFGFGTPRPVDAVVPLVKEEGQWKVCGEAFDLS